MAGGAFVDSAANKTTYPRKMMAYVLFACFVAASGGRIFGYDIGISGGVTAMDPFLAKFFPTVLEQGKRAVNYNQYCKFNSQLLIAFTSVLYFAALVACFFASAVTRIFGRQISMFGGGIVFLCGSIINSVAKNFAMLISGRILLGLGVGFANPSVPLYVSEMAPPRIRGRLNVIFQLMITLGILAANLINYFTAKIEGGWGWHVSLGVAAAPAIIITVGSIFLPDTLNSLVERGHNEQATTMLRRIRGTDDIGMEYDDIVAASEEAKAIKHPSKTLMQRKYRPQLVMSLLIPSLQQLTGINVIMFYAPVLFKTISFGVDASLMSTVISGFVNVLATFVSIVIVDRFGRRPLFLEGGIQMTISQIVVGTLIALKFGTTGQGVISKSYAVLAVFYICLFV